jgi:hypothetical protein
MLLALADAPAPGQRREQQLMDAQLERRELQPLLQVAERFVGLRVARKALEQRDVAVAEPAALRRQPAAEERAALDLQAFQEVAREQRNERSRRRAARTVDSRLDRARDL